MKSETKQVCRGRQLNGEWYIATLELSEECPWCGSAEKLNTVEFFPVTETAWGFQLEYLSKWTHERGKVQSVAFYAHFGCGPDWGYWIDKERVENDVEGWERHISQKIWADYCMFEAIRFAKNAGRQKPSRVQQKKVLTIKTYFIQSEFGGHVKIGKSVDPEARLRTLQTGRADRLIIRKLIDGDQEQELHVRFKNLRDAGEWFRFEGALAEFLQ